MSFQFLFTFLFKRHGPSISRCVFCLRLRLAISLIFSSIYSLICLFFPSLPHFFFSRMEEQPEHGSTSSSFGTGASSSNASPAVEEDAHGSRSPHHNQFRNPELDEQSIGFSYRANARVFDNDVSAAVGEDTWSCTVVLLTFWFFGSFLISFEFFLLVLLNSMTICS